MTEADEKLIQHVLSTTLTQTSDWLKFGEAKNAALIDVLFRMVSCYGQPRL